MPAENDATALWFETDYTDKPHRVAARARLVALEIAEVEWPDAHIRAPFEVLLSRWQDGTLCSTAWARPLQNGDARHVSLGTHRADGPRNWQGGGAFYRDENTIGRTLRRALPAMLKRGLWGRVLWLDRELNLATEAMSVLRLYLGANGQGEWFLPGLTEHQSVRAGFDWSEQNPTALLRESSDERLLDWVLERTEQLQSDLLFALNWTAWGTTPAANAKRVALNFRFERDALEDLQRVLRLASECDPDLAGLPHLYWEVAPLQHPARAYGDASAWRAPLNSRQTSGEFLFDGNINCGLPPLTRRVREWAHAWFGVHLDEELRARHRCVPHVKGPLTFPIQRAKSLSAHEQIESFAQLRDFLAAHVAPDEVAALLGSN